LFVANEREQSYSIIVNKSCLVEDLAKKIAEEFEEDFEYISFQQRLMHKDNTLYD
jgi:predicted GTPase